MHFLLLVSSCRSSPSRVCVTKPNSVRRLTTCCFTGFCSRSTPSNCWLPTASSTTSVSVSPLPPFFLCVSHSIFYWQHFFCPINSSVREGVKESVNLIYRATKKGLLRQLPRLPSLLLSLQICFQKTVLRRKLSRSTPTPSWPRSDTKTGRVLSSSKCPHKHLKSSAR